MKLRLGLLNGFRYAAWAAMVAATVVLGGCKQAEYKAPPPPVVTVDKPTVKEVTIYADYTGFTQAYASVDLRARVEGFLDGMHFTPGDRVEPGKLLFTIDPKPFEASRDQAAGVLAQRIAELQLADATLVRKERAYKDRAVSEVEVIEAKANKAEAEAAIKSARADLESAKINLSYTKINSPIEGRVTRNLVDTGNLVGAGEKTLLANVVDDDPIYVYFNVSANDLLFYQKETRESPDWSKKQDDPTAYMALANEEGYPHKGALDYMDNKIDQATGTIQVRGNFPNADHRILPGLFVRIRLPLVNKKDAVLVPDTAIGTDLGGKYVLVVGDKNIAEYRKIEAGPLYGAERLITSGLKAGETIIINGMQMVRPGAPVTPMTKEQMQQAEAQAQAKAEEAKGHNGQAKPAGEATGDKDKTADKAGK